MPIRAARGALTRPGSSRAGRAAALAALALLLGNTNLQNAVADGETRTISLHHIHTGEDLTITYKRDGRYDDEALKKVNHVLRDWRRNEEIRMDPRLLDVVWEVYRDVDAKGPIQVVCGYRSPSTNAMLRRRSHGVAEYSQHMLGRAMDFFIPGVPLEKQREAGLRLQRGGVGYYPSSGSPFIHLDVGNVRMWPRMSHEELARVFPDGRTVHIPSDGKPLRNYAVALADIEKRGSSAPSQMSLEAARTAGLDTPTSGRPQKSLFAALFGRKDDEADAGAARTAAAPVVLAAEKSTARTPATPARASVKTPSPKPVAPAAPAASFSLASFESRPAALRPARATDAAGLVSANDVIATRGYWPDAVAQVKPPAPKDHAAIAASEPARPTATPETTAALAPWPMKTADAADQVPSELALAYAAQARAKAPVPVTRSITLASGLARDATVIDPPRATPTLPASVRITAAPTTSLEDPWLRALVLAPDLQNYMTATPLAQADMRELRALMDKPDAVVTTAFGDDPEPGLASDRFTGGAVVFVSTVTFAKRSADLR